MKHMKMMWTAEVQIFKWRYDRLETEHRTLSRMFVIASSSCLLACKNALNFECQAKRAVRKGT